MSQVRADFGDLFVYSRQLIVVITGFYIVLVGLLWYLNSITRGRLEPFGPKIVALSGLLIFTGSSIWLIEGLNKLKETKNKI